MSVQTGSRLAAALPFVNLLPPEIQERKRVQRVQLAAGIVVIAAIGAVAFLYMQGGHGVTSAKKDLSTAAAENQTLTTRVAKFADVNTTRAELSAHEAMLTQAMSTEIKWSDYLGMFATLPTSTWLESLTLTESVAPGTLTSPTQAPRVVGSVTFKGVAQKYVSLADWLDRVATLGSVTGLANASFSTAQENFINSTKVVDFQAATTLTQAALSGRCATPGAC
jgi:Tfp pilus assembly protein PilN